MSADNGIYIAKCGENDYRVTQAGAIDNLDYFPKGSEEWKQEIRNYFSDAPSFKTEKEAHEAAHIIDEEWSGDGCPTEYGICYIGEYPLEVLSEPENLINDSYLMAKDLSNPKHIYTEETAREYCQKIVNYMKYLRENYNFTKKQ